MKVLTRIVSAITALIGIALLACLMAYRLPASSEPEFFDGKVLYKFIEISGAYRQLFEEFVMQNRVIRLEDNSVWYVSKVDYAKLWPESPHEMSKRNYTIKAKIKAQQLLFGGYSKAEIVQYERLNEAPTLKK